MRLRCPAGTLPLPTLPPQPSTPSPHCISLSFLFDILLVFSPPPSMPQGREMLRRIFIPMLPFGET